MASTNMAEHPTVSWEAMQDGNVFYRRQQLYSIPRKLPPLEEYIIAGCRCGGPIALMRDSSKILVARSGSTPSKSLIQVYSSAGEALLTFSWDQAKIIRFGWTQDERLVVLNEEGVYRSYDLQGNYQQYSLGPDAGEVGIVDARIYESGMVALTGSLTLLEVKGWEGGRTLTLANPGLSDPPQAWAVIPPDSNISRHVEVLLSVGTSIHAVDSLESVDQRLSRGPFTFVSPSPNGKSLALLTFNGILWVVSTDFQRNLAEFDTSLVAGTEGAVNQVEWCGNDAILVTWDSLAVLVGPYGDTLKYAYSGHTFALTEMDGVRVLSSDVCDLIQKVPAPCVSIFRPGSTSPSAILFDAWEGFERRSARADESVRSLQPDLATAVDECIQAAGLEWEPTWQRRLLNAAKFGRGYLDLYDPTDFVAMGQTLRVLNAVRYYEIGIPLTYSQYIYTSPSHLIGRLTSRNLHLLAFRVSTSLSLKPDPVLRHWACTKIARSRSSTAGTVQDAEQAADEGLCKLIVDKFQNLGKGRVSYADIAKRAWEVGKTGLATKLLDHEPRASDQVPLLLKMKENHLALQKAVDSGDTDLVYLVLLQLYKHSTLGTFFRLIEDGGPRLALASRLLQVYAREQNRDMLRDFYYSDDRRVESAVLALDEASHMTDSASRITTTKAAQKFFSEDKDHAFEAKMTDESVRLLNLQLQLEKEDEARSPFFGLTVNETIRTCLLSGMGKRAEKVRADFKVPDKRFWYIKLQALTAMRDFEGLEAFAKSKRSPIGYEPFVHHLVEKGFRKEAIPYVARCEPHKRVDLYVECGEWKLAGKECKDSGNVAKLEQLRKSCRDPLALRELDQIASTMK